MQNLYMKIAHLITKRQLSVLKMTHHYHSTSIYTDARLHKHLLFQTAGVKSLTHNRFCWLEKITFKHISKYADV